MNPPTTTTVRAMSFNIRVMTPNDGPNQWMYRRDAVAGMIAAGNVDLLGLQEATRPQIDDLVARLDGNAWVGRGRIEGERAEFCPVFYHRERFDLLDQGNFWLSEKPEEPVLGWDAGCVRITTWARLRHRQTERALVLFNTHLDHKGEIARTEGAKLLRQRVSAIALGEPTIVMGDFNCGMDSAAYRTMIEGSGALRDARLSSRDGHTGPVETFTGFRGGDRPPGRPPHLIDYIFVSPDLPVVRTETLPEDWHGRQLSDHRAILADLDLRPAGATNSQ